MQNLFVRAIAKLIPSRSTRRKFTDFFLDKSGDQFFNHAYDMGGRLGRHSYMGEGCWVYHPDTAIGSFCAIAHNVLIGAGQHPLTYLSIHPFQYTTTFGVQGRSGTTFNSYASVTIGHDVWIGGNVVIMDGVSIGNGAVIGSNAVVTRDVPPYAIALGVPARVIRYRFDEAVIRDLQALRWWDLDDKQLADLPFSDVARCISELKAIREQK